ncbi:hypothetical protein [Georgenia daeguensis]
MLDRTARARLRTLSKNNADLVARHLVMAGRLIDGDPATAYEHAQAAMRRAGRVDVVREALAVTAYATGNYAEALRELRTVRRLSGIDAHRPMEADCERGLGRPERALTVVAETDPASLSEHDRVELAIVASGARADLGETEAGLLVLESALVGKVTRPELRRRLDLVKAERLEELGKSEEARVLRDAAGPEPEPAEEIVVLDLADDFPQGERRPVEAEYSPEGEDSSADTEQVAEQVAEPDADAESPEQADGAEGAEAVAQTDSAIDEAGSADEVVDVRDPSTASADVASEEDSEEFEQAELDLDVSDKERE